MPGFSSASVIREAGTTLVTKLRPWLMPTGVRLPFGSVFVFGLGESKGFSESRYREYTQRIRGVGRQVEGHAADELPSGKIQGWPPDFYGLSTTR